MTAQRERERLSAKEILAYDDEQLDQYLEANRRRVAVQDPENLTEEFIQRLRDRTHQPKSAPVDPLKLTTRLLEAPTYQERPSAPSLSPASLASTVVVTEEEEYENAKQYQREAYHELIDSGGRPTHSLEQMEEIVKDPGELREILSFWQVGLSGHDWEVFRPQRAQWKEFQTIQRHVRDGRFRYETDLFWARRNKTWEDFAQEFPETVNGTFSFPDYAQSAQERLARHGFTRSFELDLDLTKQDKLTTWIEYLNWEYMRYEDYAYNAKQRQRLHDKAWKKLVDSGVLKPGETEEVLFTLDHGLQSSADRHGAERTIDLAKRSLASAERAIASSRTSRLPLQQLQSRVDAARAKLTIAEEAHTRIKLRNDCISDFCQTTMDFRSYSRKAERHLKLLRWMLQQIPLIEQESSPSVGSCAERDPREADSPPSGAATSTSANRAPTRSQPGGAASKLSQAQPLNAVSSARSSTKRRRAEGGDDDAHGSKRAKRADNGETLTCAHASATAESTLTVKPEDQSPPSNGHVRRTRPRTWQHSAYGELETRAAAGPRRSTRIAALPKPEPRTTIALAPLPPRRRYTSRTHPLSPASSKGSNLRRRKPDDSSRWTKNTRMKKARRKAVIRDA